MKKISKRAVKGYKILPNIYQKAKKRADKEKMPLAKQIEDWVSFYANGKNIYVVDKQAVTNE